MHRVSFRTRRVKMQFCLACEAYSPLTCSIAGRDAANRPAGDITGAHGRSADHLVPEEQVALREGDPD